MIFHWRDKFATIVVLLALNASILAQSKAFDTGFMDTTVAACDNFYRTRSAAG